MPQSRVDILRKVRSLTKLAEGNPSAAEGEAALRKATALRLKHGIGDDEMAMLMDAEEIEFFGHRFLFYGNKIGPLMNRIRGAVETAVGMIGSEHQDAIELLEHFRKDLKFQEAQVVKARDAIVKQRYQQKRAELYPNWDDEQDGPHAHNITVQYMKGDLRKDVVERIVGVSETAIWKKHIAWMDAQEAVSEETADA